MTFFTSTSGNDTFTGTAGGWDIVDYRSDYENGGTAGIVVNLADGRATDGWGNTDILASIEGIWATRGADRLTGSHYHQSFVGGRGADVINGGGNFNSLDYSTEQQYMGGTRGVIVNFATGKATDTFGTIDTLSNIGGVRGTSFADVFVGSARIYTDDLGVRQDYEDFTGMAGADTINGGHGYDAVSHAMDPAGIVANLPAGTITDGWGAIDRVRNVERVNGSSFNDVMTGGLNSWVDAWGNTQSFQSFRGNDGADTIDGGAGYDEILYDRDPGRVRVNLALGQAIDGWGKTDILVSIEAVRGSAYNDTIVGSAGGDSLRGMAGNDILNGGGGIDEVRYSSDVGAVVVNLALGTATDGWGHTDTLRYIENIRGSRFGDTLIGNGGSNRLTGMAGADLLNGGAGVDMVSYHKDATAGGTRGVSVNLGTNRARDGFGNTDILSSIEQAEGTRFNDVLVGNGSANLLSGMEGRDVLNGGAGADTLLGGAGNDTYYVDNTSDRVYETTTTTSSTNAGGTDKVFSSVSFNLSANKGVSFVENLTLKGVSAINGTGNALKNVIVGNAGANTLAGGRRADRLTGGLGADRFRYGSRADGGDTITDFSARQGDRMEFGRSAFGGLPTGGLASSRFESVASGGATKSGTRFVYNSTEKALYFDADGNGGTAAVRIATLSNGAVLRNTDIFIV